MIKAPRLIILILSITGLLFSTEGKTQVFKKSRRCKSVFQKFESLLQLIDYAYVEDVDDAKIVEDAVINMF